MRPKRGQIAHRNLRIADQIHRDLSMLILQEVKDVRIGLVTITSVEISRDYAHAKVYFSLLKGDPASSEAGLNSAAGFLRRQLFTRLQIHTVPSLHFVVDNTTTHALAISKLIGEATGSAPPTPTPAGNALLP